jgi:hypothetical protein
MSPPYFAYFLSLCRSSREPIALRTSRIFPPPSFNTSLRITPAPKGLRSSAQGQPSLSEATLGYAPSIREANPPSRRIHSSSAASAKRPATVLTSHVRPTPFFATLLRSTPAPTGLRNTAQGCRALASAPLGMAISDREANPSLRHTQQAPAASAKRPATVLTSHVRPTPSFATLLRSTPAPTGLRNTAQGCRALASAPLGIDKHIREANPPLLRTHRSPAASAKRPAAHLRAR